MKKFLALFFFFFLLVGCGPQVMIEIDPEQTRIIYDEELGMVSFFVRLENTGQLPAHDLYARFLIDSPVISNAIGGIDQFIFSDSQGVPERFELKSNSSYFIAEAFSLDTEINYEEMLDSISVEIHDKNGNVIAKHLFNQVTSE